MAVHLWLRAEKKPNERRTHITPERCKDLVKAGELMLELFYLLFWGTGQRFPVVSFRVKTCK